MKLLTTKLGFGYPGFPVGRDVGLTLEPGEVLCLLGPNGCGKTTLFKTLLGLIPKQSGQIRFDGHNLGDMPRRDVAKSVAYVPQAHDAVFPYSVLDMVVMGRTTHKGLFQGVGKADRDLAEQALNTLGITDLANRDYTRISGGQRQLVLIARALAQSAKLIIMDEPTASLDFGNQVLVLSEVRKLANSGLGIVFSTHNPDHAFACGTRVLVLDEGQTRAEGPPQTVLTPELLSSVYGVRIQVEVLSNGTCVCVPEFS